MFGLRFTTDTQARSKNGHPTHSTTGVVKTSCTQFDAVRPIACRTLSPRTISAIASATTGNPMAAPSRNRRVMSFSSGFGWSVRSTVCASSAMPHTGQLPGRGSRTSGSIGQTNQAPGGAASTVVPCEACPAPTSVRAPAPASAGVTAARNCVGSVLNAVWQPPQQK